MAFAHAIAEEHGGHGHAASPQSDAFAHAAPRNAARTGRGELASEWHSYTLADERGEHGRGELASEWHSYTRSPTSAARTGRGELAKRMAFVHAIAEERGVYEPSITRES